MAPSKNAISVKWLHHGEYRRFTLDLATTPQEVGVVASLMTKLRKLVPDFNGQLGWRDSDDDLIVFSSDDELMEAIKQIPEAEPLRIFTVVRNDRGKVVKAKSVVAEKKEEVRVEAEPKNETDSGVVVHDGVICDACDSPICGVRFKCIECPDFDLCSACDANNVHKDAGHTFIRISDPKDKSWRRVMWPRFGPGLRRGAGSLRGPRCGPMGPMGMPLGPRARLGRNRPGPGEPAGPNMPIIPGEALLRQVGQSVANALSSLGIDVDVDVEDDKGSRNNVFDTEKKESAEPKPESKPQTDKVVSEAQKPEEVVDKKEEQTPVEETRQEWTLVDNPTQSVYPTAPLGEMIQESLLETNLKQLVAMGFTNEGGWLAKLLEAKNGEVNAVLDALNPRRSH